jgi:sirohydrochlorin ferrochelatase
MRDARLTAVAGLAPALAGRAPGQAVPPLVAVAHGSTDPRAAATITGLMGLVGELAARRGLAAPDTRIAYLGHAPPSVTQVLGALAGSGLAGSGLAGSGLAGPGLAGPGLAGPGLAARQRHVVVLPLLLTAAYHSEADLPALLDVARGTFPGLRISYGEPLGPHPLLLRALDRRLAECGGPAAPGIANTGITRPAGPLPDGQRPALARPVPSSPGDIAVVLASAGSRRPAASAVIARVAARWQAARGWRAVVPAYAATAAPTPGEAVSALLRGGAPCVLVATYLLAPGVFADQVAAASLRAGAAAVSGALGAAPEVAEVVLRQYGRAIARPGRLDSARPGDVNRETGSCR